MLDLHERKHGLNRFLRWRCHFADYDRACGCDASYGWDWVYVSFPAFGYSWFVAYVLMQGAVVGGRLDAHMYGVFNMVYGLGNTGKYFRLPGVAMFWSRDAVADMDS